MSRRRRLSRLIARACALAAAVMSIAGGTLVIASNAASAASLGAVTLSQQDGLVDQTPMFASAVSARPCPTGFGENAALRVGPPAGPYSNLAVSLGGGDFDLAPVTVNANRSFQTALGGVKPADGQWVVIIECYSLTEGRHPDEFRTPIIVCGNAWAVGNTCPQPKEETETALTVSPTWSVVATEEVTLTASVTPAAATGEVEFFYDSPDDDKGPQSLGKGPVTGGQAVLKTTTIPANLKDKFHDLTAVFTAASTAPYHGSTSAKVRLNVRNPGETIPSEVTVAVSPAGTANHGAEVTITAMVSPPEATGKVALRYRRGTSTTVVTIAEVDVVDHVASTKTTDLPGGTLSIDAAFTSATFSGSASTPVTYVIVGGEDEPDKRPTTTTLTATPDGEQPQNTSIILTATVAPTGTAGTVTFRDGAKVLGTPKPLNPTSSAAISVNDLAIGTHRITAEFVPTDSTTFAGSTSAAKTITITDGDDDPGSDDPGSDDPGSGDGGSLPRTGAPIVGVAMVGGGLVGIGLLAVTAGRRRRLLPSVPWLDRADDGA
ncbi:Ig-like domain-containing protein [Asanoa ferruginea]|uniref:Ig-like domain-containing protein n=1 Tax=Asanoa ferruginea TaxID=53367 RepID=A0A3D9ZJG2_9ACTN|nr:Ig-like domain-containing protein [Asanoa ferruginea]REF97367.1 Ig-like domain-containing protein [Asanoa ferruginea]GIF51168.1 hypothetical protein Afe04nite_57070 [Asanoa ferruginea]